jgi:hypothetical protein
MPVRPIREQSQDTEAPTGFAGGDASYGYATQEGLREAKAAFTAAMTANDRRQADAASWMDRPLSDPAPSGDRGPTHETYSGHVGEVLGVGRAPGATPPLLPEAQVNSRLPDPPALAPPVVSSVARPKGGAGLWFSQHQQPTEASSPARPVFVSVDAPGGRSGGLWGALKRLFGGAR